MECFTLRSGVIPISDFAHEGSLSDLAVPVVLNILPDYLEYKYYYECLAYIEDLMIQHGPFDGLLGFSQGGILSAALPGLQSKGLALTRVPKVKFVIIIGGATFLSPSLREEAYSHKIGCKSLHFIGENDFLRERGELLLQSFIKPLTIYHPKGHIIPRLEKKDMETMFEFIKRIKEDSSEDSLEDQQHVEEISPIFCSN